MPGLRIRGNGRFWRIIRGGHLLSICKTDSKGILYSTPETQDYIKRIIQATPTYKRGDLGKVMLANSKPKIHPYYSEYRPLPKLCLQIIRREDLSQMISYLHITSSKTGIFICPSELLVMNPDNGEYYPDTKFILRQDELFVYKVGDLSGDGGRILIIGLNIPRSPSTYRDFAAAMSLAETGLLKALQGNI